jgi:predicted nuclease with TOPRIM domain
METHLDALKKNNLTMEDIVLEPIKKNSYHISESVLKQMDKVKQLNKMYKSPKHYEYDPHLNGLHEPGSNQVAINQALNDRMKTLEAQNLALENRLKRLEAVLSSKHFLDFTSKLEEMTDKLDDLQSKIDLLDE